MPADLMMLLPPYFQGIQEYGILMGVEESELDAFEKSMGQIKKNLYVQTCDDTTLREYEQLLGIVREPGTSLDYRRQAVLTHMNRQLPYSLPKLKEMLDAAVGRGWYSLDVRYHAYELELDIIDQPYQMLKNMQYMTEEIIPAHLLFVFAGLYPVEIPVVTRASSRLELLSDFFARYNREFLYLDGTWDLDGTYLLNGYKEAAGLDLYPLELTIRSSLPVRNAADSRSFHVLSKISREMKVRSGLLLRSSERVEIKSGSQQRIRGHTAIPADTETLTAYESDAVASQGTRTELILRTEEPAAMVTESAAGISQQVFTKPEVMCRLTVEKDLWYLDGTYLLDGTKLLDAEIFNYDL